MKSGTERSDKYAAKFDAEVVRSRFAATATLAKAAQVTRQAQLAETAGMVRGILNAAGEYPIVTVTYMSFNNKLFGIVDKFGGGYATQQYSLVAKNVALLEIAKWKDMGGKDAILKDIWDIYAIALGSPPSPVP